ncbi:hypothetical protein HVZ99_24400 (plasmid) [Escherichia coli]|nr:hypothetical protein HVZ99_24400 [Escherichia coli]BDI54082.1 hypothetical protein EsCd1KSP079_05538 [Escherichia sp. KS167_9B]
MILKTGSPKDEHPGDVYKVMKIISVTGITVMNTEDIHFFSDSSEKKSKRLVRTVLIFTESSDQLSRATDRVPGLPASPGYAQ